MRDLQEKCPLVGVEGLKRIEVYDDELKFVAKDSDIDLVQMSSEPHRNFFLIGMDGIVFKYDLVTKELLFQFKTNATKAMLLYDKDDKVVVASEDEVRLWDFYDHKEEAPELITMAVPALKVENIYINKNGEDEAPPYVLITCQNEFILYQKRLETVFRASIEKGVITSACFNKNSTMLLIGTSLGQIFAYKVNQNGEAEPNPFQQQQELPITKIECLRAIEENEAYLITVDGKDLYVYVQNKADTRAVDYGDDGQNFLGHDICNVHIAANNKFFAIGIPSQRALGFFGMNRSQLVTKPLKWITKF
jgi:WD40 repeat protein